MHRTISAMPLLLLLAACAEPAYRFATDAGHRETGQPALHAIHDSRLRELMDRMSHLVQERFLTEPELDSERRKYAKPIADTARKLSQTIDAILATMPMLKLGEAEQTTFHALAHKLGEQTRVLQEQAERQRMNAIPDTLQQLNTTCTSCHALFRKL